MTADTRGRVAGRLRSRHLVNWILSSNLTHLQEGRSESVRQREELSSDNNTLTPPAHFKKAVRQMRYPDAHLLLVVTGLERMEYENLYRELHPP